MIRADVYHPYFRKFLWVFLGCIAFCGYCLYDGLVKYPTQLTHAEAYESLPEDGRQDAWKELAQQKGWPSKTPSKSAKDLRHLIGSQFMMFGLSFAFAIPAILMYMSGQGTWVEGDDTILRNSKGKEVPIESITKIDKTKWEAKGIAKIYYDEDGKKKKFVMDDFKYDRATMGELMKFAEAHLAEEQIVGDYLERDKEALRKQEEELEQQQREKVAQEELEREDESVDA